MTKGAAGTVDGFLQQLWERKGTDLHFSVGAPVLLRVDGNLERAGEHVLTAEDTVALVGSLLGQDQREALEDRLELDFSFSWRDVARIRGNAFFQQGTVAMALRLIPSDIPKMADLGLPPVAEQLVSAPQGFVLVTGPTGAGKSTTLASMIDHINERRACHIITIEDPLEYLHSHKRAAVNQREVGVDTESFERALRSVLREDPDVVLVGEMRDLESIQIALTIAETGHLVFATLHTNDTAQALDRMIDVFPPHQQDQIRVQLANSLSGILYQRLIPRARGGLVAAFEVLLASPAVRNLVREGKTHQLRNVIATSQGEGMQTMEGALNELVAHDVISYETAMAYSLYPKELVKPAPVAPLPGQPGAPGMAPPPPP
ncbi:MAG TPA: type IV pilus twitching motility protein PilT, partial [Acidimicrobiales bacterium]|nr:type IV pilus twitching motility protein PilT [Acidimicrobiales bacterium]